MKLPVYIRQSWQIILKDKRYSLIYITGVALSMALVTVFLMVLTMLLGDIYPERHRGRILVMDRVLYANPSEGSVNTSISSAPELVRFIKESHIEGADAVSVMKKMSDNIPVMVRDKAVLYADARYVDGDFWKVFDFDFISGGPFGHGNVEGLEVVISSTLAQKCFGTEEAVGRVLTVRGRPVTVCGVVRDVSAMAMTTDAEIWLTMDMSEPKLAECVLFSAVSRRHVKDVQAAVRAVLEQYNDLQTDESMRILPDDMLPESIQKRQTGSLGQFISNISLIVVIILLIPAVNLCGMVSSSLRERLSEFGVRKSYGAPFRAMSVQIFSENLLLTLIGGVLGYLISFALFDSISFYFSETVIGFGAGGAAKDVDLVYPVEPFFRPGIYLLILAAVLLLNTFSSVQPVFRVLRRDSVSLLRDNDATVASSRRRGVWLVVEVLLVVVIGWLMGSPVIMNAVRRCVVPMGWEPDRVVCVPVHSLAAFDAAYSPDGNADERLRDDFERIGWSIAALDGVEAVTPSMQDFPGSLRSSMLQVFADTLRKFNTTCYTARYGSDFMEVFGIKTVVSGGNPAQTEGSLDGIVISEDLAEEFFPEGKPVGKSLYVADWGGEPVRKTVSGVMFRQKPHAPVYIPQPAVVVSVREFPVDNIRLGGCCWHVRVSKGTDMRKFIQTLDSRMAEHGLFGELAAGGAYSLRDEIERIPKISRAVPLIVLCYLLLNLILGALSHYMLQTRRRIDEFGVRIAMGSSPGRLRRDIVTGSLCLSALSVGIGLLVVFNMRMLRQIQYDYSYMPEATLAPWPVLTSPFLSALMVTLVVAAVVFAVNALAALVSVWKVSGMRPSEALREE